MAKKDQIIQRKYICFFTKIEKLIVSVENSFSLLLEDPYCTTHYEGHLIIKKNNNNNLERSHNAKPVLDMIIP